MNKASRHLERASELLGFGEFTWGRLPDTVKGMVFNNLEKERWTKNISQVSKEFDSRVVEARKMNRAKRVQLYAEAYETIHRAWRLLNKIDSWRVANAIESCSLLTDISDFEDLEEKKFKRSKVILSMGINADKETTVKECQILFMYAMVISPRAFGYFDESVQYDYSIAKAAYKIDQSALDQYALIIDELDELYEQKSRLIQSYNKVKTSYVRQDMKRIVGMFGVMFNKGTLQKVVQDLESLVNNNRSKPNTHINTEPDLYYNWIKRIEKLRRTINAYHMKQSILVPEETTSAIKSIIRNEEIVLFSGVSEGKIHHSFKAEEIGSTVCAAIDVLFILKYQMPLNKFELVYDENVQKGECIVKIKLTNGAMNTEEIEKVLRGVIGACGIDAVISIDK